MLGGMGIVVVRVLAVAVAIVAIVLALRTKNPKIARIAWSVAIVLIMGSALAWWLLDITGIQLTPR